MSDGIRVYRFDRLEAAMRAVVGFEAVDWYWRLETAPVRLDESGQLTPEFALTVNVLGGALPGMDEEESGE